MSNSTTLNLPTDSDAFNTGKRRGLMPLCEDILYLAILAKENSIQGNIVNFQEQLDELLNKFSKDAKIDGYTKKEIDTCKFALCAFFDEQILSTLSNIRDEWEQHPLQVKYFNQHLAGEEFFNRLDLLREELEDNIDCIEVFHYCLLLGFQGKYRIEGFEKLKYLTGRLGMDINKVRKNTSILSPRWQLSDKVGNIIKHELPIPLFALFLCVLAGIVYTSMNLLLNSDIRNIQDSEKLAITYAKQTTNAQSASLDTNTVTSATVTIPVEKPDATQTLAQ